jgi:hypothetical protein
MTLLTVCVLLSLAFTPGVFALNSIQQQSPSENIRVKIENGFGNYLNKKGAQISSSKQAETSLASFLKEFPVYQSYFAEYANLTRPNVCKLIPFDENPNVLSVEKEPFLVRNETLNGTSYQVSFSKGQYDNGKTFTQAVIGCGGLDPQVYVEIVPLTINILGFNVQYGEDDAIGFRTMNYSDTQAFMEDFDAKMDDASTFVQLAFSAMGIAFGLSGVTAPLAGVMVLVGTLESREITYFKDRVDTFANPSYGLQLCFENYWVYPTFLLPLNLFNDLKIYVRTWYGGSNDWEVAFPHYTYLFHYLVSGLTGSAMAWASSNIIHTIGDIIGYNSWNPAYPEYPLPDPSPGSTGLLYRAVNTYDSEENPIAANVYIDGTLAGSNNPSLIITPETHTVGVDKIIPVYGNYGYIFDSMQVEGNTYYENEADVALSTNSTITADYTYGEIIHTITLQAYDYTFDTQIYPAVYVDENYAGNAWDTIYVTHGYHTIYFEDPVWNDEAYRYAYFSWMGYMGDYSSNSWYVNIDSDGNLGAAYYSESK